MDALNNQRNLKQQSKKKLHEKTKISHKNTKSRKILVTMITVIMMVRTRKMSSFMCGNNTVSREKSTEQNGAVDAQASVSILYTESSSKDSTRF